jgi:hypothetical protein
MSSVVRTAWLSVAATAGALLGFGVRAGSPASLFSAAGDRLRGLPPFVAPDRGFRVSAGLGVLHHVALVVVWSIAFALLVRRVRGRMVVIAAATFAALAIVIDALLPPVLRFAAGAMTPAQRVVYCVVLGVALGTGMRLAQREGVGA